MKENFINILTVYVKLKFYLMVDIPRVTHGTTHLIKKN